MSRMLAWWWGKNGWELVELAPVDRREIQVGSDSSAESVVSEDGTVDMTRLLSIEDLVFLKMCRIDPWA